MMALEITALRTWFKGGIVAYFKPSIFRILIVLEIDLLFGNYIRIGVTVDLGNGVKLCSRCSNGIGLMVLFFYLMTWSPHL